MVAAIILPTLARHKALNTELHRSADAIAGYLAEIDQLKALKAQQEAHGTTDVGEGSLMQGSSEAVAAAQIQQRIKTAFERHGQTLERVQFLPSRQDGLLRMVALRFTAKAPLEAVQAALHELETEMPFLVVESMEARRKIRPAESTASEQEDRDLIVEISLFGMWAAAS